MSHEATPGELSDPSATPALKRGGLRPLRLLAIALPIALVIVLVLVIPGWIPLWPRPLRRAVTEGMLRTVLLLYSALFLAAFAGTPVLGWLLARSWRTRTARMGLERGFLVCLASLLSLPLLEIGSACWSAWVHRFPVLPTRFEAAPADEYRIVVLGGSSALGEPYRPWLSVGQIVAWQLQQAVTNRRFECEILARLGASLENQHHALAAIKQRSDAVIIYSGHNEFAARFEEEREGWPDEEPASWIARRAYRATLNSSFCMLAYEIISKNRLDTPPPLAGRHQLIDPPQCSPSEAAAILSDFRRRLEALVSYCDRIGALPILIIPPANEAGYEPSRSTLPPTVSGPDRRRLVEQFTEARVLEQHDPAAGAVEYTAILERHPGFAEAHFRLARSLEKQGSAAEAAGHYLAALENDGLPIRCPAPFRAAYEEVARRHPRSILIDGRRELIAVSPDGQLGDHVIQDTHHPTLRGYVALASAVLRELERKKVFSDAQALKLPLDATACADHFAMDKERWTAMCERTSVHYKRVAGYRYDPTERLEKSRRYAEAARRFARDKPVSDLGLPGLPDAANPRAGQEFQVPDSSVHAGVSLRSHPASSVDDLFDLPVLQVDHRAAAQEVDHRHELIPLRPADHLADHAGQRTGCDSNGCPDRHDVFRGDRQARAQDGVHLTEVACQRLLINDLDHAHQPVAAQREQAVVDITLQEHVTREERDNRLDFPSLGRASFFQYLGKVIDGPQGPELAGRRLFLSRLCMQAPPDRLAVGRMDRRIIP